MLNLFKHKKVLFLSKNFAETFSDPLSNFSTLDAQMHLVTNSFFERNESYKNTLGVKKVIDKVILSKDSFVSDWQVLRKLSSKFKFIGNFDKNSSITYENKSNLNMDYYRSFHFEATPRLFNLSFYSETASKKFVIYRVFSRFKTLDI